MQYRNTSYSEGVFDVYWFEKNLQGDIVAVYNQAGTKLISYTYDAWGNCTTTYYNGGASTTATYNPFRYRGYYFDSETGFYYCGSRYYDPVIGRWINADGYVSTGQGLLGYNMYAYCNNNPVNMNDKSGYLAQFINDFMKGCANIGAITKAIHSYRSTILKIVIATGVALLSGDATIEDVVTDITNYRFLNTDEQKCIEARVFSSYKGTPVIKHNISGGSMSAFNTIFLSNEDKNVETVKHEWGHTAQQSILGTVKFVQRMAIPSLVGAVFCDYDVYFSQPWERSADFLGGATHEYSENSEIWATIYFFVSWVV